MNSSLKIDDLLKYRVDKVVFRKVVDKKIRQYKRKKGFFPISKKDCL